VKFTWVILIYFATSVLIGILLTAYVFVRRKWRFTFLPFGKIVAVTRSLSRVSSHAFLFGQTSIISSVLGTILSGITSGLTAAGDFTLVQKVFSLLITSHLAILAPVAPAVTRESSSGDWDSVRRRLRVCIFQLWPALFLGGGILAWWAHPVIIRLWAGKWLYRYQLAALLLVWACLNGFINTFSVFLNSLGLIKIQAAMGLALIVPSLLLPLLLARWFGPPGIALSMVICSLPAAVIWPLYTRRALRLQLLRV
jgi:O-antigen/teichoic acid export membrane protein